MPGSHAHAARRPHPPPHETQPIPRRAARAAIPASDLPAVAARAGLAPAHVAALLASQDDIAYDRRAGALLFACRNTVDGDAGEGGAAAVVHGGGGGPLLPAPPRPRPFAAAAPDDDGPRSDADGGWAAAVRRSRRSNRAPAPTAQRPAGYFDLTAAPVAYAPPPAQLPSADPAGPDPADTALAFKLHSRPGAPKRILLDFDGGSWLLSCCRCWPVLQVSLAGAAAAAGFANQP